MSELRFPSEVSRNAKEADGGTIPLQVCEAAQQTGGLCSPANTKVSRVLSDVGKENIPPSGASDQPTSTFFKPITNRLHQVQPSVSNYNVQFQYQLRRPVEPWKYQERKSSDGSVVFACSLCCAVYKHKKSLNKHWKDKHVLSGGNTGTSVEDESDSLDDSTLIEGVSMGASQSSPPLHRMRASLRRLPQESPSTTTMMKRRRSDIPLPSTSQSAPLDLSVARTKENEVVVERVGEVDACTPLRDRVIITLLIQSALDALNAEPPSVQTTDTVSPSTSSLLRAVGSVLIGSTEPKTEPVVPSNDRKRSDETPVPCQICPYVGRWHSEVKAHVVNHSRHKMFGCCFCNYRSKWKWDVAKHMRKCLNACNVAHLPNEALIRMIVFHPPPPDDILYMYYSENASSSSVNSSQQPQMLQPPPSSAAFSNSLQTLEQIAAPEVGEGTENGDGRDEPAQSTAGPQAAVPPDPPVLELAVKSGDEGEREASREDHPTSPTQDEGESENTAEFKTDKSS